MGKRRKASNLDHPRKWPILLAINNWKMLSPLPYNLQCMNHSQIQIPFLLIYLRQPLVSINWIPYDLQTCPVVKRQKFPTYSQICSKCKETEVIERSNFNFIFSTWFQWLSPFLALKKSYVDVFNPSGAPAKPIEPIMAPSVPVPSIPQSGFFVPGSVPAAGDVSIYRKCEEIIVSPPYQNNEIIPKIRSHKMF